MAGRPINSEKNEKLSDIIKKYDERVFVKVGEDTGMILIFVCHRFLIQKHYHVAVIAKKSDEIWSTMVTELNGIISNGALRMFAVRKLKTIIETNGEEIPKNVDDVVENVHNSSFSSENSDSSTRTYFFDF